MASRMLGLALLVVSLLAGTTAEAYNVSCSKKVDIKVGFNQSFGIKSSKVPESRSITCKISQGCLCEAEFCVYVPDGTTQKINYTQNNSCAKPASGVDLSTTVPKANVPPDCTQATKDVSQNANFMGVKCTIAQGCRCSALVCSKPKVNVTNKKCVALPG